MARKKTSDEMVEMVEQLSPEVMAQLIRAVRRDQRSSRRRRVSEASKELMRRSEETGGGTIEHWESWGG